LEVAGHPDPPLSIVEALGAHSGQLDGPLASLWNGRSDGSSTDRRRRDIVVRAVAGAGRSPARTWLLGRLDDADLSRSDLRLIIDSLLPTSWPSKPTTVPAGAVAGRLEREAVRALE